MQRPQIRKLQTRPLEYPSHVKPNSFWRSLMSRCVVKFLGTRYAGINDITHKGLVCHYDLDSVGLAAVRCNAHPDCVTDEAIVQLLSDSPEPESTSQFRGRTFSLSASNTQRV